MCIKLPHLLLTVILAGLLLTGCHGPTESYPDLELDSVVTPDDESANAPVSETDQLMKPESEPEPEAESAPEPIRQLTLNDGIVELYTEEVKTENGVKTVHRYVFSSGETVEMGRLEATGGMAVLATISVGTGSVHSYDPVTDSWTEEGLSVGAYKGNWLALTLDDGASALLYLPKVYRTQPENSVEYLPDYDGMLKIKAVGSGRDLTMTAALPDEPVSVEYMLIQSDGALFDENDPDCWEIWKTCLLESTGMWCLDGFYRATPTDYTPTGEHYFYRCPASYLVKQAIEIADAGQQGGKVLTIAMLDTIVQQQNMYGFWETGPQSGWLFQDYGLNAGFYDTRFNTDLATLLVRACNAWGGDRFLETLERYGDFFLSYAKDHHFSTDSGWFVEDYYHPDGGEATHCSLNHQAAECSLLYAMAELLDRPELAALADTMVNAIRDTGMAWVMEDHDLYYCIYPDGTHGRDDYPYLTYNDLLTLQKELEARNGARDDVITAIMAEKKIWMDNNQVTGYWTE